MSLRKTGVPGATTQDMAAGRCAEPGCWHEGQRDLIEDFTVHEHPEGVEFVIRSVCERGHPFAFSVQTAENARDLLAHTLSDLRSRQAPELADLRARLTGRFVS